MEGEQPFHIARSEIGYDQATGLLANLQGFFVNLVF